MTSRIDYKAAPPGVIIREIGEGLAVNRLQRNITQAELAKQAGIATRTLRRLESGEGATLDTLIRLLQALGMAQSLDLLLPKGNLSPMQSIQNARSESASTRAPRKRARKARTEKPAGSWSWDEKETP